MLYGLFALVLGTRLYILLSAVPVNPPSMLPFLNGLVIGFGLAVAIRLAEK